MSDLDVLNRIQSFLATPGLGERPSPAELLAWEFPEVDFIIPHLGSFADDWSAQLTLCGLLAARPNLFADTSGPTSGRMVHTRRDGVVLLGGNPQ